MVVVPVQPTCGSSGVVLWFLNYLVQKVIMLNSILLDTLLVKVQQQAVALSALNVCVQKHFVNQRTRCCMVGTQSVVQEQQLMMFNFFVDTAGISA